MDILSIANEWAKDEIFSAKIFILFGVIFVIAAIGFWQLGRTDLAKAFTYPTLLCGLLVVATGTGFVFSNKKRLANFEKDYQIDAAAFVKAEIDRTEQTIGTYRNIAFKVFPAIVAVLAILLIFLPSPLWRAICISVIALFVGILVLDGNALARMENYNAELKQIRD